MHTYFLPRLSDVGKAAFFLIVFYWGAIAQAQEPRPLLLPSGTLNPSTAASPLGLPSAEFVVLFDSQLFPHLYLFFPQQPALSILLEVESRNPVFFFLVIPTRVYGGISDPHPKLDLEGKKKKAIFFTFLTPACIICNFVY